MSIRAWAMVPWVLSLALGAQAQTAAPAKPDAKPEAKPDAKADAAAEAAAAMERAKRMAAGPMRVILEASKARRREAEPAPAAAEASSVRPVVTRNVAASDPAPRQAAVPVAAVPAATVPATTAPAVETVAPPAPAPAAVSTQITLSSEALQGRGAAPVPALERATMGTAPNVAAPPLSLPVVPQGPVKPRLVNRVDPELPQRLLDDLGRNAVIPVDLTIRADGTVAQVSLVSSTPVRVQRAVVAALEQWRFDPLPNERVHRFELVFNGE